MHHPLLIGRDCTQYETILSATTWQQYYFRLLLLSCHYRRHPPWFHLRHRDQFRPRLSSKHPEPLIVFPRSRRAIHRRRQQIRQGHQTPTVHWPSLCRPLSPLLSARRAPSVGCPRRLLALPPSFDERKDRSINKRRRVRPCSFEACEACQKGDAGGR